MDFGEHAHRLDQDRAADDVRRAPAIVERAHDTVTARALSLKASDAAFA
jgi:hypothetical protein